MAAQKRTLEGSSSTRKAKKLKTESDQKNTKLPTTVLLVEEVDFPRGGGTSFTPLEVKAIRAEAVKEANEELIKDASAKTIQKKRRKSKEVSVQTRRSEGNAKLRIEHLNYKRIHVGMKIFGQITGILPLALIISLPNQLYAHVPITNISSQFTELLERMEAEEPPSDYDEDEEAEATKRTAMPGLADIFRVGQYVRAIVSAVHPAGKNDVPGIEKSQNETSKACKRVELSLVPERLNIGVKKSDLVQGFTLTASIKSQEDHGFALDLGIDDVSGFLPFKEIAEGESKELYTGALVDVTVTKSSAKGRICTVSLDSSRFSTSHLSEISSVTSVLPGTLVQGLITNVDKTGLNLQVLGYFDGIVDEFHLGQEYSFYNIGKKVKARVLYDYSSSPPKFSLSLTDHTVRLTPRLIRDGEMDKTIPEVYPVGLIFEAVKILRVEPERGLTAEVSPGVEGFIHISQVSDNHVDSLPNAGPWKPGSLHPARVTGYFDFDGLLQLTLKPSILQRKYLRAADVEVGELVKGIIKKLTDSCLFVSLSEGLDGVIWPNHYSDIMLRHPSKRFKEGASIKCRVLVVDPERNRIALTAKKTLLESDLPIISKAEDVKQGMVTYGVVFKVYEKHFIVEFYNNMKAVILQREIGEITGQLLETFPIGRVVKVRILGMQESRITASIKQASAEFDVVTDIGSIEVGHTVEGTITEIHKDNVLVTLQPSRVRALLSLKNLANCRNQTVVELRNVLEVGEKLGDLVVVSRNPDRGIVIVANKPKPKHSLSKGSNLTLETIAIGQLIGGRITRHLKNGALVKITSHIRGILHLTDLSDNFDSGAQLPEIDSVIKAAVVGIDVSKKQLTLSTRPSRMRPDEKYEVVDQETNSLADLEVGQTVRGFVKNIMEHGLFVTIGRDIDARVQIKELFDDYVKDWKGHFKMNQVVKGRILSIDTENKKVELAFRTKDPPRKETGSIVKLSDLKEGEKVEGVVKKIEEYGLFIQIKDSKLNGLCHKSQLSDNPDADVSVALRSFREGDRVKTLILKIENKRISLGLKPSYFNEEDFAEAEKQNALDEGDEDDSPQHQVGNEDYNVEMALDFHGSDEEMDIVLDSQQVEFDGMTMKATQRGQASLTHAPTLTSLGGFQWSGSAQADDDEQATSSSSSNEDDDTKPGKKRRKRKEIEQDLTADMHSNMPDSNADFERLLLGSPNSSYLWIQYMSFQLPLSEVDKAREIAHRAVRTINFREERERLNVWIALMNLENIYGTDETLDAVFKEAARANDSKTVHLRLASIFDESEKWDKAEEQYKRTCKKFGQSSKAWTLFGQFLLKRGELEEARKLLPRSLQGLEKRKHLKTISQFALLEYKHGDPERGKTLFEGIIDSHPKRWDMWSMYMDMEGIQKNIHSLRNLFDRVFAMKMTSHKAKAFFKKWLELEKRLGDEKGVETVKERAVEWTQKAASNSS